MKINNTVALISGSNRGIGKVFVESLLARGAAKVYAGARSVQSLAELAKAYPDKVVPVELDLTKPDTLISAARQAADVQLVINNAGMLKVAGPLADNAIECLKEEMEVNVHGLLRMAQAFAPVLKANGGGAFVQLNSVASLKSFPDFATYCASKAAAYSITQALREVLGAQGTAVVSVHPGPIDTDMARNAGLGEIAEPPQVVADALIAGLEAGEFHVFPDSLARQMGQAYHSFAQAVVESAAGEG